MAQESSRERLSDPTPLFRPYRRLHNHEHHGSLVILPYGDQYTQKSTIILIGANGGIGSAIVTQIVASTELSSHLMACTMFATRQQTHSVLYCIIAAIRPRSR